MGRDDHGKKHDRHAVIMAWSWTCFAMIMVWSWQDHAMAAMIFQSGRRTQKPIKERLKKVMPVDFYISVTCDKEAWCDFTKKIVEPTLFVSRTRLSRMRIFFWSTKQLAVHHRSRLSFVAVHGNELIALSKSAWFVSCILGRHAEFVSIQCVILALRQFSIKYVTSSFSMSKFGVDSQVREWIWVAQMRKKI